MVFSRILYHVILYYLYCLWLLISNQIMLHIYLMLPYFHHIKLDRILYVYIYISNCMTMAYSKWMFLNFRRALYMHCTVLSYRKQWWIRKSQMRESAAHVSKQHAHMYSPVKDGSLFRITVVPWSRVSGVWPARTASEISITNSSYLIRLFSRSFNARSDLMGKLTISIAIFTSKLLNYERVYHK